MNTFPCPRCFTFAGHCWKVTDEPAWVFGVLLASPHSPVFPSPTPVLSCLVSDAFLRCLKTFPQQGRVQINQPVNQPAKQGFFCTSLGQGLPVILRHTSNHVSITGQGDGPGGREETTYKSGFNTHAQPTSLLSDML